jgi:hypothetical protein
VLRRHTKAMSLDARLLLTARGIRSIADGMISLVLPAYLIELGYGPWETGAIATATLVGSSILTLGIGLYGRRWSPRTLLPGAAVLMTLTGLCFFGFEGFWPLLLDLNEPDPLDGSGPAGEVAKISIMHGAPPLRIDATASRRSRPLSRSTLCL